MTHDEAAEIVNRCGADKAPPVPGKLVHAWAGWANHEARPPRIVYTWDQVSEARKIIKYGGTDQELIDNARE